ncbi:MAG TPA: aminodeoxychorismate/anthranilate synthase component II [Methylomirabilota bacterium]|nr:aminodeoxychorismate/anthranilate synthase component II [Methylomirabilota bacterium]
MKVLIIDNYDSFVYNLAQYTGKLGAEPIVHRTNEITLSNVRKLKPDKIIISPGPGSPNDPKYFGISGEVLRQVSRETPTLGVCLGNQGIAWAFGGRVVPAKRLMHGKTSLIKHEQDGIFENVPNPLQATRYHSLVCDKKSLPKCLEITAESLDDHEIMGLRHREYPIYGIQFHPESILTPDGITIMRNFIEEI